MFALFLESKAADQVRMYVAGRPDKDLGELLKLAYQRGMDLHASRQLKHYALPITDVAEPQQLKAYEDWWVTLCLEGDNHKRIDIDELIVWGHTPEGRGFWSKIQYNDDDDVDDVDF